ncbi:MAG: hypothetical protein R3194_07650 [Limnobacter sp.]|nr:hypothetical protein [Limnobacter sp.]
MDIKAPGNSDKTTDIAANQTDAAQKAPKGGASSKPANGSATQAAATSNNQKLLAAQPDSNPKLPSRPTNFDVPKMPIRQASESSLETGANESKKVTFNERKSVRPIMKFNTLAAKMRLTPDQARAKLFQTPAEFQAAKKEAKLEKKLDASFADPNNLNPFRWK